MRCQCCDKLLTEWESKARDPFSKSEFLDLCNTCRYHSNPYTWLDDDSDSVINKEDINIDNP